MPFGDTNTPAPPNPYPRNHDNLYYHQYYYSYQSKNLSIFIVFVEPHSRFPALLQDRVQLVLRPFQSSLIYISVEVLQLGTDRSDPDR